uniref:SCP2 domain-containing protein n=1 Tax=Strix occidentalis caurina TaxID=311401 RepID=A0A8D0F4S3_STROC
MDTSAWKSELQTLTGTCHSVSSSLGGSTKETNGMVQKLVELVNQATRSLGDLASILGSNTTLWYLFVCLPDKWEFHVTSIKALFSYSPNIIAIHTAAMDMLGGHGIEKQCRKTDILADAAYCILTKPKSFTGNFIIDEVLLREEGVKDFDVYAIAPGHPLMPDFFLDVETDVTKNNLFLVGASQAFKEEKKLSSSQHEGPESAPAKPLSPVAETFRVIQEAMSEEYVRSTQGVFQFELSGDEGGTWYIDLKTKGGSAGFGKPSVTADVVMSMSSADFVKMFTGKLKPTLAFMSGKLRIKGNMTLAIKLEKMLTQLNSKL